jgi:PPOX class probable F420-dependent enzyme
MLEIPTKMRATVKRRLKEEYFVWLTTVGTDLSPQPRPVWFIWDAPLGSFLIYSQPHAHKVRHIEKHPNVALHFNADATGDNELLVFIGVAEIDLDAPPGNKVRAYMNKYREGIAGLNSTPEEFAREYSVAIRVTPTSVRGW